MLICETWGLDVVRLFSYVLMVVVFRVNECLVCLKVVVLVWRVFTFVMNCLGFRLFCV